MYPDSVAETTMPDWAAIAAVVLGITAFAVGQGLTYPLITLVLAGHGVPAGLIGVNGAAYAVGMGLATLLVAPLTARIAGDRLIILSLLACAASFVLFATSTALWAWFVARLLLGAGAGLVFILCDAWLVTACPDRLRGRVSGVYGMGLALGFASGPLLIPLFGTQDGFAFAMLAVYVAFVAFAVALLSRRTRTKPAAAPIGALMRFTKAAPLLVAMVFAFGFADIAAISGMPLYLVRTGHGESFAAIVVTALALPTAFAQPVVGYLLDKLPRHLVALGCGSITALSFFAIPFLDGQVAILAAIAVMGAASFSLWTCAITLLGAGYSGAMVSAGSAVFSLAYAVGSGAGSTAIGVAMNLFSPQAGPIAIGLGVLLLTPFFARAGRRA